MILEITDIEQLRKIKGKKIIRARDLTFNRKLIEKKLVDILVFPSNENKKNSIKYLDSGLNSISLKLAAKNNVIIGIDLNYLRELDKKKLSEELAKLSQDIKICRKCNTDLGYTGQKDSLDAKAFLTALGASTRQSSRAISF